MKFFRFCLRFCLRVALGVCATLGVLGVLYAVLFYAVWTNDEFAKFVGRIGDALGF